MTHADTALARRIEAAEAANARGCTAIHPQAAAIEIAGMPRSELGRNFNEDQMGVRAATLRTAYKVARQLILDIAAK